MPRVALTRQTIVQTGIAPTYAAAEADGNSFANPSSSAQMVHVKNGHSSPITVTVLTPRTVDGLAVADMAVTVADGTDKLIGPFPGLTFNQTGGAVHIDYDVVTDITVGVFTITPAA